MVIGFIRGLLSGSVQGVAQVIISFRRFIGILVGVLFAVAWDLPPAIPADTGVNLTATVLGLLILLSVASGLVKVIDGVTKHVFKILPRLFQLTVEMMVGWVSVTLAMFAVDEVVFLQVVQVLIPVYLVLIIVEGVAFGGSD